MLRMKKGDFVANGDPVDPGYANPLVPAFTQGRIIGLGGCKDFMVEFFLDNDEKTTVAVNEEELLPATTH